MRSRFAVAVFLTAVAGEALACSAVSWDETTVVQNEVVASANGRYLAVVRQIEGVPDFSRRLAGELPGWGKDAPPRTSVTTALYESVDRARRPIGEISISTESFDRILVADDGRTVVAIRPIYSGPCGKRTESGDPFVTIYNDAGVVVGRLTAGEVFTAADLRAVMTDFRGGDVSYALRHESDTREVLLVGVRVTKERSAERRIDLTTGVVLDPITDLFPAPEVRISAVDIEQRPMLAAPADCAGAFANRAVVAVSTEELVDRMIAAPPPAFPDLMIKARIRGPVIADILVGEDGSVLCARASGLPFGGSEAAIEAARQWRFRPLRVDGRNLPFLGQVLFRFE